MRTSNPMMREEAFRGTTTVGVISDDRMTINGTIWKSLVLLVLAAFTFMWSWEMFSTGASERAIAISGAAGLVGFVIAIVLNFKQSWSPVLAPVFALVEGALLGGVSAYYEQGYSSQVGYDGIVAQAMIGTMVVFVTMLTLYRAGIIKVTDRLRAVVTTAALAIFLTYLASWVLSMFGTGIPFIMDNGAIGIGFSLLVIGVFSLMLAVDFDMIERGAQMGAPKYMEWYGSFALLVTVIWIYLEMLRLLSKLRSR